MTRTLCALVMTFAVPSTIGLHADAAAVSGTVTAGPRSAPIANARVSLHTPEGRQAMETDGDGRFHFASLLAGTPYVLVIEAEGLRSYSSEPMVLRDGEQRRLEVLMEFAGPEYSMVVAGRAVDVSGSGGELTRAADARQIADLPSVTRSTTKYALLNPHVRQVLGLGADFQDSFRLSINAGSYRHTGYMLDGTSTYDWIYANSPQVTVPPSAVREVNVLTGQFSAQYGLSTTGVVSITTASGSDHLRGETFAHIRPDGMQARPPVATFDVPNNRGDVGFTIGGPVRAARTHFFGSYEAAKQHRGAYIQSPSAGFFEGETREQSGLVRIDHRASNDQALTVRGNASEYTTNNANDRVSGFNQPSFGRRSHTQSIGGQVDLRSVFGRQVNQLRSSYVSYVPDSAVPLHPSVQVVRPNFATDGFSTENWVHARTFQIGDHLALQ